MTSAVASTRTRVTSDEPARGGVRCGGDVALPAAPTTSRHQAASRLRIIVTIRAPQGSELVALVGQGRGRAVGSVAS